LQPDHAVKHHFIKLCSTSRASIPPPSGLFDKHQQLASRFRDRARFLQANFIER
ncbi:hypothetical protein CERZMDRAFT_91314, partial [Cercospora zeae-maydis SCOH1-5]